MAVRHDSGVATITAEIIIQSPADAVWEVLAHQFERVGEWATAIPSSTRSPHGNAHEGVAVTARICSTGVRMVHEIEERIVAYDEARRSLTYEGRGMPKFIKTARNRWQVQPLGDQRSRVTVEATLEPRGVIGRFMYVFLRLQLARIGPQFLDDLKHYVEHGEPSARKQRQLRAATR
jgi:hypothetical protein